jgi:hypothetical protein
VCTQTRGRRRRLFHVDDATPPFAIMGIITDTVALPEFVTAFLHFRSQGILL